MNSERTQGLLASSAAVRAAAKRVIVADDAAAIGAAALGVAEIFRRAAATVPLVRRKD